VKIQQISSNAYFVPSYSRQEIIVAYDTTVTLPGLTMFADEPETEMGDEESELEPVAAIPITGC
jgi:hypothetical protein